MDPIDVTSIPKENYSKLLPLLESSIRLGCKQVKKEDVLINVEDFIEEIKKELNPIDSNEVQECFDKLLNLYKNTGRGLEYELAKRVYNHSVWQELIDTNKIELINSRIGNWYYPKDFYCFEKETNSMQSLLFLDAYLGTQPDEWMKITINEIKSNPEYNIWKERNKEILEKSFGLEKQ